MENVPEVCGLKCRRFTLCDVQSDLEARVQNVQEAICKAPEEEKNRDQGDGDDGLTGSQSAGTSNNAVVNALAADLLLDDLDGRRAATLLFVHLIDGRLLRAIDTEELHGESESLNKDQSREAGVERRTQREKLEADELVVKH